MKKLLKFMTSSTIEAKSWRYLFVMATLTLAASALGADIKNVIIPITIISLCMYL